MFTRDKMFLALYQAKLDEGAGTAFSVLRRIALNHDSYKVVATKELITDNEPEGLYWYTLLTDGDIFSVNDNSSETIATAVIAALDDLNTWKEETPSGKGSLKLSFGISKSGDNKGEGVFWLSVKKNGVKTVTELLLEVQAGEGGEGSGGTHPETIVFQTGEPVAETFGYWSELGGTITVGVDQLGFVQQTPVFINKVLQSGSNITISVAPSPNNVSVEKSFLSGVTLSYPGVGSPQVYLNADSSTFDQSNGTSSWIWTNVSGTFNITDDITLTATFDIN